MCGICGIVSGSPLSEQETLGVREMNKALIHRGPDSEGFFSDSNVALAMRRLKIIDIAGGDQPLYNEEESLVLIANGEIYNHIELRAELEGKGHIFRSRSDCEPILHLYEEEGVNCLHKLRGMFVFALYDKHRKKLFIARDRLSEKPLYYYMNGKKELVFSSEMKSLLSCLHRGDLKIDFNAINMYFHYQYVPEPYTCVEGVRKLDAAHYMTVSIEDFSVAMNKYWDFEDVEPIAGNTSELIRESFDELSRIIIRADVPVGISLSGGIDSGAIAVYASKHYREHMHAFSVGYPGRPANDEREKARKLAEKMGLAYHDVELRTEDLVNSFQNMVYFMDDPIADIAAFGYYSVSELAREHGVPVLLGGLGGDELFWGYDWVRHAVRKSLIKRDIFSGGKKEYGYRLSGILLAHSIIGKKRMLLEPGKSIKRILAAIEMERNKFYNNPDRFIFYEESADFINSSGALSYLYTDEFKGRTNGGAIYSFFSDKDWSNVPVKICKFLFNTWLYSNCIALGDRMSMAHSVENRLPFLDYRLVELVMGLRKAYGNDYQLGYKSWFIDAMKNILPAEVLGRKKQGFTPPVVEWYKAIVERYGILPCEGYLVSSGAMNVDSLVQFIKKASVSDGSLFLAYKIVLFDMWYRRVVLREDV